eukprot:TRINITY_DN469_c0_g3_i1.p2 TRINITY_DN469_c0_g3~~TRINITY_DN469_c0_g3_i1.p2  ORF type:complete len:106 (+),score=19.31 TRINITY_DN469_c0_g3_i1:180-497(+)
MRFVEDKQTHKRPRRADCIGESDGAKLADTGADGTCHEASVAGMLAATVSVADGIEVRFTGPARGRAVFATRSFVVGEVVLEERPFLMCETSEEFLSSSREQLQE